MVTSSEPGSYDYSRPGEILRCPWHGWEFDVRTGRSWCDPKRLRLMNYAVTVEPGAKLVEGPYVAETSRWRSRTTTWWWRRSEGRGAQISAPGRDFKNSATHHRNAR